MSRSAIEPLMLGTATIEPPSPASIMASAAVRIVNQVPVRLTASARSTPRGLFEQHALGCDSGAGHHPHEGGPAREHNGKH